MWVKFLDEFPPITLSRSCEVFAYLCRKGLILRYKLNKFLPIFSMFLDQRWWNQYCIVTDNADDCHAYRCNGRHTTSGLVHMQQVAKWATWIFYVNSLGLCALKNLKLLIQDTNSSQTQQFHYIIKLKATCFNSIELSSGLLEKRSNVSTFIVHSGIPKAYNGWYSQYKSTHVRDLIINRVEYL